MQSLSLKVDLDAQRVEGRATLWVVLPALPPPPAAAADADDPAAAAAHPHHHEQQQQRPIDYRLHARQMAITAVRVNGESVPFTYPALPLDLLRSFVPPTEDGDGSGDGDDGRCSGEAADLHYRCQFVAAQEGELGLQLPPGDGWSPERDAGGDGAEEEAPKVILNMRNVRVRADAPTHDDDGDYGSCDGQCMRAHVRTCVE